MGGEMWEGLILTLEGPANVLVHRGESYGFRCPEGERSGGGGWGCEVVAGEKRHGRDGDGGEAHGAVFDWIETDF